MNVRKSWLWFAPVLALACLLAPPTDVEAQCGYTTSTNMGGTFNTVFKQLTTPTMTVCTRTMNNAFSCNPVGPVNTTGLFASAKTASTMTMAVSCGWNCGCGMVLTDGSDGLPVELMEFEIGDIADDETRPSTRG